MDLQDETPAPARLRAILDLWSAAGETTRLRVEGTCMRPLILEGDLVHVVHGVRQPRLGDVVLFRENEAIRIQRVVRLESAGGSVVLKGDDEIATGSTVALPQILGVVRAVERGGSILHLDRWLWRRLNALIAWTSLREARIRERRGMAYGLATRVARVVPLRALGPAHLASRFVFRRG